MMKTYKIVDTNITHFKGINLPFDFQNYKLGDWVDLFGSKVQITQKGDTVVAMASKTQIFVFQELVETD
jgi:hypothetical protein